MDRQTMAQNNSAQFEIFGLKTNRYIDKSHLFQQFTQKKLHPSPNRICEINSFMYVNQYISSVYDSRISSLLYCVHVLRLDLFLVYTYFQITHGADNQENQVKKCSNFTTGPQSILMNFPLCQPVHFNQFRFYWLYNCTN
jgi:hypothetical protein